MTTGSDLRDGSGLAKVDRADLRMQERKEPTFVKFETEGEFAEGVLLGIEQIEVGEDRKRAIRYTVRDPKTREAFAFLGTHQINTKITTEDKGHYVQVMYSGTDDNVQRNGNSMRLFRVLVSDKPYVNLAPARKVNTATDDTGITDEDIPF